MRRPSVAPSPAERLAGALGRIAEATRDRESAGIEHGRADDDVGTIDSDDAIGFDPRPVLQALSAHGAQAVVIGQVAGILHGSRELTGDLDLLWSGADGDAPAMEAAFRSLGALLTDDDGVPIDMADAFELPKVLFRTGSAAGDCCTPRLPWKDLDVAGFIDRAVTAEIDGAIVRYLTIDDLIAMRRRPDGRRISGMLPTSNVIASGGSSRASG